MLVQSIDDLKNTTEELNMELESLGDDDGGKIFISYKFLVCIFTRVFWLDLYYTYSFVCFLGPWSGRQG